MTLNSYDRESLMDKKINKAKSIDIITADSSNEETSESQLIRDTIERFYFAHRGITKKADEYLLGQGLGRAHFRIIYFTSTRAGISVGELVGLLEITNQGISKVLSQLIKQNYIVQKADTLDRRRRLLYLTNKGKKIEEVVIKIQSEKILQAFANSGPEAVLIFQKVLSLFGNPDNSDS